MLLQVPNLPIHFQMCDEVTEIQCDVVPYTECAMEMEETPYKSYDMEQQIYRRKSCTEGMDVVQHTKMMPECRNVTKQNCITKWETDDDGNQVRRSGMVSFGIELQRATKEYVL